MILCASAMVHTMSCKQQQSTLQTQQRLHDGEQPMVQALPHVIVYKTTVECANLVPITLDASGTRVVSYPAMVDITAGGKPQEICDGWLLDRRGIRPTTAFTDYTYEQYAALQEQPSATELYQHIRYRNAITEMWDCGTTPLSLKELQKLVRAGFPGCMQIFFAPTLQR